MEFRPRNGGMSGGSNLQRTDARAVVESFLLDFGEADSQDACRQVMPNAVSISPAKLVALQTQSASLAEMGLDSLDIAARTEHNRVAYAAVRMRSLQEFAQSSTVCAVVTRLGCGSGCKLACPCSSVWRSVSVWVGSRQSHCCGDLAIRC